MKKTTKLLLELLWVIYKLIAISVMTAMLIGYITGGTRFINSTGQDAYIECSKNCEVLLIGKDEI